MLLIESCGYYVRLSDTKTNWAQGDEIVWVYIILGTTIEFRHLTNQLKMINVYVLMD